MTRYRLLLADDHAIFRAGLRRLVEEQDDLVVIGEAATGAEAIALTDRERPDVLVLDVQMPGMSGPDVVRELRRREHPPRIIGLSAHDDLVFVEGFARWGASGYVTKDRSPMMVVEAIRQVAQGMPVWLVGQPITSPIYALTEREREILVQLAEGLANEEIAERLFISESTVRNTLTGIYDKIGVKNARAAVAWAWRNRLVEGSEGN